MKICHITAEQMQDLLNDIRDISGDIHRNKTTVDKIEHIDERLEDMESILDDVFKGE